MLLGRAGTAPWLRSTDAGAAPGSGPEAGASKPRAVVHPPVTEDATLSDFLQSDAADDGDATDDCRADSDAVTGDAETSGTSDESLDGASRSAGDAGLSELATYAWGVYSCSRCGRETERVWREDGAIVCPDCKPW